MRQIYGGSVALFAGIAVFIVADRNRRTPGTEFTSNFSEHRTHTRG